MSIRSIASAVLGVAAIAMTLTAPPVYADSQGSTPLPAVSPTPQSMTARPDGFPLPPVVGVVAGTGTDVPALDATVQVLRSAGVRDVRRYDEDDEPATPVTVYVGGPAENRATADALEALRVDGPDGLAAEGYVLAAGRGRDDRARVVLAGAGGAGTFYAAQTLRQLITGGPGQPRLPGVVVRDWPAFAMRGALEVHYGPVWSQQDRLRHLRFAGAHKSNAFFYGPVEDPYADYRWRDPYPADQLADLADLVRTAQANHVEFVYSFNPSTRTSAADRICYSSDDDFAKLAGKMQQLWDIGVRRYAIAFDDINTSFACASDTARFGNDANPPAAAQAYVINRIQREFVEARDTAKPLIVVPTDYWQPGTTPYRARFADLVDAKVVVYWTGDGVFSRTIDAALARKHTAIFKHPLLVWDNYPVNDFDRNRLFLGPVVGRTADLASEVAGFTANTMNEAEASKISLATIADYSWNPGGYQPERSWELALREFAGRAYPAFKVFAENSRGTPWLDIQESPTLSRLIAAFWAGRSSRDTAALADYFGRMRRAAGDLRAQLDNPRFLEEAAGYLDKLTDYGTAGEAAVRMLAAQRGGDGSTAWRQRLLLDASAARAATNQKKVAEGIVDPFLAQARATSDRWFGFSGKTATPTTTMGTWSDNQPQRMVDGDPATFYWSNRSPGSGDTIGVDLGEPVRIGAIDIRMTTPGFPREFVHNGVVETSADGVTWQQVAEVHEQPEIHLDGAGAQARYVRLRSTGSQENWVMVREFSVAEPGTRLTVDGGPPPAEGSELAAAADASSQTVYRAGRSPAAGDALTVTFPAPRPLDAVAVLQDPERPASAAVQVRSNGQWRTVGKLSGGYTELEAGDVTVDAVRLAWSAGSPAPAVYDVVPWYADEPPVEVTVDPAATSAESGGSAETTVHLLARGRDEQHSTLAVRGPAGWRLDPSSRPVVIHRGDDVTVPVTATVPAEVATGRYAVQVQLGNGPALTWNVDVFPPVTDTDVARDGTASASSVVLNLPQFRAEHVNDGDPATRWASNEGPGWDSEWVQVELASPVRVGKVVLTWEAAYGAAYAVQGSADGESWETLANVTDGDGGTDVLRMDSGTPVRFVRMQGVRRFNPDWGFSLWELAVYPVRS